MNANPLEQAHAAYSAGRFDQAYSICLQLLNGGYDNDHVRHLAAVSAAQANQLALASEHALALVHMTDNTSYQLNAARVLERGGHLDDARTANEAVLEQTPGQPDALANLANIARLSSDTDAALALYGQALAQREDATVLANYAGLLNQLERHDDARASIERALELEPDAPDLQSAAADIAVAGGRFDDATTLYEKALTQAPRAIDIMTNLATAQLQGQHVKAALARADEVDRLDPGNRTAAAVRYIAALKEGREKDAAAQMNVDACIARADKNIGAGYDSLDAFTQALRDEVLAHPSLRFEPDGKTTRKGSQSANLLPDAGPALSALRALIVEHVDAYLAGNHHNALRAARHMPCYDLNVWVTVLNEGGHQAPHIHPAGVVSGVYYVAVPNPAASAIEFGTPPDAYAPVASTLTHTVAPAAGTLLLFPSQFYHRTLPGHTEGLRISIAFDVLPKNVDDGLPPNVQRVLAQARQALANGQIQAAENALGTLNTAAAQRPQVHVARHRIALARGNTDGAAQQLRAALDQVPRMTAWWRLLAGVHMRAGDYAAALEALNRALDINPEDEAARMTLAAVHTDQGNADAAVAVYRDIVAARPDAGQAWYGLSLQAGAARSADDLAILRDALEGAESLAAGDRIGLHFCLARAADSAGDVDTAFEQFAAGNATKRQERPFDADSEERNTDRIVSAFTPAVFSAFKGAGSEDATPVLIVGMPRSGSTLLEQILSAHPDVAAAGETNALWRTLSTLPEHLPPGSSLPRDIAAVPAESWATLARSYVERLRRDAGNAPRITDKLPFNYTLLGMLRLMLPNATIIDARRHPLDTCWSCFTTSFGNERGFTTDLTDLGRTYRAYDRLMAHWQRVLPGGCHTVHYEALVDDTEAQIRALLAALGLDWHDDCLSFFDNPRAVMTASYAQVRQPIYTSSVGRWQPYEGHLAPLRAALGSLAERP